MKYSQRKFLPLPESPAGKTGWPWTATTTNKPESLPGGLPWTKISVVTPSYNQGQFIEETIRSVLLQGYPNLEYIIIDGGSTDNTLEIIKRYEAWLAYWVSEPDNGQSHAVNKGIKRATGDILFWLNSDDMLLPSAFHLVAKQFCDNPAFKLVIGQARLIDSNGEIVGEVRSRFSTWEELATNPRNSIRQIATFFSKELFDDFGLLNENLHIAMDTDLLVRFTQFNTPLIVSDYLTAFRIQPAAKTASQLLRGYEETDRIRRKFLKDKRLKSIYRSRSSAKWISLFELNTFSRSERIACLIKAIKIEPKAIFTRRFWSSLKNHIFFR